MDVLFGLVGDGFALVCADTSTATSIIVQRMNYDKIAQLDSHKLLGLSGEHGDYIAFSEFVKANMQLYQYRNDQQLTTKAAANFTRGELATALRKGPYQANMVLAGYDEGEGVSLYYLDYMATLHRMNCCGHGYGAMFINSLFDKYWRPNMPLEEAVALVDKCIAEIRLRLVVAPPSYIIKIVDKDGCRVLHERFSGEIDNSS